MSLSRVPFGGLRSLEADELIGFEASIDATNCVLDDGALRGRSGYRKVAASALSASANVQSLARYRHGPLNTAGWDAHSIAVISGGIYAIEDPSSETASDGAVATLETVAAWSGAAISTAAHGKHLYIASDVENSPWRRVKPYSDPITGAHAPSIETLLALERGAIPTKGTTVGITSKAFLASPADTITASSGVTAATVQTDWTQASRSGGSHCVAGDSVTVEIAGSSGADWSNYGIMVVGVSPPSYSAGQGNVDIQLGDKNGVYRTVGTVRDGATGTGGSGCVAYIYLTGIESSFLSNIRYIKFSMASGEGVFGIYGYALVPRRPGVGTMTYRTTFYDSSTEQESVPTDTLDVTLSTDITWPQWHMVYRSYDDWAGTGSQTTSIDPVALPSGRNCNSDSGMTTPTRDEFVGAPTITQAIPSSLQAAGTIRLWRLTPNGYRVARTQTWSTTTTSVSLVDNLGDTVLSAQLYKAQGTPPRCAAMSSRAGRIISAYDNRLWISSFISPSKTSNPFPSFPAVALESADGWAFDVSPAKTEQIAAIINGDALYVLTNECCYSMPDVDPGSPCYTVVRRGVIGRQAAVYAEDRLFWASADGLYSATNRSQWEEVSQPIRRAWISWLAPTRETVLAYQDRKLFVVCGTRYLRLDFVTGTWTRGTFTDTMVVASSFSDSGVATGRLFWVGSDMKLYRMQSSATADDDSAIPNWTYRTGYLRGDTKLRLGRILADVYGTITARMYKGVTENAAKYRSATLTTGTADVECEYPFPADLGSYKWCLYLSGASTSYVRYAAIDVAPIQQVGG